MPSHLVNLLWHLAICKIISRFIQAIWDFCIWMVVAVMLFESVNAIRVNGLLWYAHRAQNRMIRMLRTEVGDRFTAILEVFLAIRMWAVVYLWECPVRNTFEPSQFNFIIYRSTVVLFGKHLFKKKTMNEKYDFECLQAQINRNLLKLTSFSIASCFIFVWSHLKGTFGWIRV